jgi:hypothetical protein
MRKRTYDLEKSNGSLAMNLNKMMYNPVIGKNPMILNEGEVV